MDIAALSMASAQSQIRSGTSLAIMDNVMNVSEQQGIQLMEMLQESPVPHPTLGSQVDLKL